MYAVAMTTDAYESLSVMCDVLEFGDNLPSQFLLPTQSIKLPYLSRMRDFLSRILLD